MTVSDHSDRASRIAMLGVLRVLTSAMLVIDAVIHLQQAANYQLAAPGGIGAGNIFRIEAMFAILAAAFVLLRASRLSFFVALVVAGSAFAAVLVYRYVDIAGFGPIPSMYEPVWFPAKTFSAVAEGIGALSAAVAIALLSRTSSGKGSANSIPKP